MTLSQQQIRDKCRSNLSPFEKPNIWVHILLKREGTFLTKILPRHGAARAPQLGAG
jgi:hypothetical protein